MPTHNHVVRTILAALLTLCAASCPALAQSDEVSVDARLGQRQAYLGEEVEFQVVVTNASPDSAPAFDWPDGLEARFNGSNSITQQFSSLDPNTGRMRLQSQNTTLLSYRLTATESGTYTIPSASLTIDGEEFTTSPVTLTVLDPPEADDFDLVIELDRSSVYVGETLRLRCHWYLTASVSEYTFRPSQKHPSIEVLAEDPSQSSRREQLYPIDIYGIQAVGRVRDATFQGRPTRVLYFELLVRPTEEGAFDLGPLAVLFDRRTNRGTFERTISRSEPITLEVRRPPQDTMPPGYTGLIGDFDLRLTVEPTEAYVGEPIDLTVTVVGNEPMSQVRAGPDLASIPGFTDSFRLSPDGWEREPARAGTRVFSTKVRALSPEVSQLPGLRLPYFDPEAAEYRVATTDPVPLDITGVRTTTLADAVSGVTPAEPASTVRRAGPIFWAEDRGAALLAREPVSLAAALASPAWIAAATIPPGAYAALVLLTAWRRSRNPELARTLARLDTARRTAGTDPARAARDATAAALAIDPDAVASTDVSRLPLEPDDRDALAGALRSAEGVYSGARPPTPADPNRVGRAIASLRDAIKRSTAHGRVAS
ncbi:MAG: BatD family protein [Phycisphaerales bacterium JB040]